MMKIALVQMRTRASKAESLEIARQEILRAAGSGADMVVLPEMFCCPYSNRDFVKNAEPRGGQIYTAMSEAAREAGVYLLAGSYPESDNGQIYNASYMFSPEKHEHIAAYRKMHLFDIHVPNGQVFRESDTLTAGDRLAVVDTPWGRCGICICFDIRFPELARLYALMGVRLLLVPAAFNMTTGPVHWELIMRARALDNQMFVAACAPARDEHSVYVSYGNSLIASPWGDVPCRLDEREGMLMCELDLDRCREVREELPLISARREDIYTLEMR